VQFPYTVLTVILPDGVLLSSLSQFVNPMIRSKREII